MREVDFLFEGEEIHSLERNPDTKSRWATMARDGQKVIQFLVDRRYVANEVGGKVTFTARDLRTGSTRGLLTDLSNADQLHDWRLPLPLCKREGFHLICVRPVKTLTVTIENRRQPLPMLPAFVFSELSSFAVRVD